jgi:hypothetical protein
MLYRTLPSQPPRAEVAERWKRAELSFENPSVARGEALRKLRGEVLLGRLAWASRLAHHESMQITVGRNPRFYPNYVRLKEHRNVTNSLPEILVCLQPTAPDYANLKAIETKLKLR